MPTYQYVCTECGTPLEVVQSFTDPALVECPTCGGRLRKVFSAVGVVFKGSGFYRNDSRREKATAGAAAKSSGDSKASADSGSSGDGKPSSSKDGGSGSSSKDSSSSSSSTSKSSSTGGSTTGTSSSGSSAGKASAAKD